MWDATCPDMLASSYHFQATCRAGKVASVARSLCPMTLYFMKELGRRIMVDTGDERAYCHLMLQHQSVAI